MEHKQGRIAPGYVIWNSEIGFLSGENHRILAELISLELVDPENFGLDELGSALRGLPGYVEIDKPGPKQFWFPDICKRIAELAETNAMAVESDGPVPGVS